MSQFFVENWQVIISIAAAIGALVVFGNNLADLILKWRDVLDSTKSRRPLTAQSLAAVDDAKKTIIRGKRFEATAESVNNGNAQKFRLRAENRELTFRDVLNLWETDSEFVEFYITLFKKCGFDSYIWETPPVSTDTASHTFEFILLNTPVSSGTADYSAFEEHYDLNNNHHGVVSFPNLGHDAILVVPSPFRKDANYSNLANFFRDAPIDQQHAIWKVTAHQLKLQLSEKPIWVSVAGGGIDWLHIRLDNKPKYYRYTPFTL